MFSAANICGLVTCRIHDLYGVQPRGEAALPAEARCPHSLGPVQCDLAVNAGPLSQAHQELHRREMVLKGKLSHINSI